MLSFISSACSRVMWLAGSSGSVSGLPRRGGNGGSVSEPDSESFGDVIRFVGGPGGGLAR